MRLSPPSVIGPVSVCNKLVTVRGQLTGATVLVLRNGDTSHPIAKGIASWPDQVFVLTDLPAEGLQPGDKLTAMQQLNDDQSDVSPDAVEVQPFDPASLEKVICLSHLYVCGRHLLCGGMTPGARLEIGQGGLRGAADAVDGVAHVAITPPLHTDEQLAMRQVACGQQGPLCYTPAPDPTPTIADRLPTPAIAAQPYACDRAVYIVDVVAGAEVTLSRTSAAPVTAGFDVDAAWLAFDSPQLVEGESLTVSQAMPGCEVKDSMPSPARRVLPTEPVPPQIANRLCAWSQKVPLSGLTPGAKVRILQNGSEWAVAEAPEASFAFNVAPLEPGTSITAQQERCGIWSPESAPAVLVEDAPEEMRPPAIAVDRLYECGVVVPITDAYIGSWLTVFSERLGQISASSCASGTDMVVAVQPALQAGDAIYAVQTACGNVKIRSASVPVEAAPQLGYPEIVAPVVAEQPSITVRNIVPGAIVEIYVNGLFVVARNVGEPEITVDIASALPGRGLLVGDRLNARQLLCNRATTLNRELEVEVVRPLPLAPVGLTPNGGEMGRRPTLHWVDPAAGQVGRADAFELQITVNGTLVTPPPVTSLSFTFTDDLPYSASVAWKVRGRNTTGSGPWSQASFRVETQPSEVAFVRLSYRIGPFSEPGTENATGTIMWIFTPLSFTGTSGTSTRFTQVKNYSVPLTNVAPGKFYIFVEDSVDNLRVGRWMIQAQNPTGVIGCPADLISGMNNTIHYHERIDGCVVNDTGYPGD